MARDPMVPVDPGATIDRLVNPSETVPPYSVTDDNSVVRTATGAVVKRHPSRAKALAHSRALNSSYDVGETAYRVMDEHAERWLPTSEQLALEESEKTAGYSVTKSPFSASTTSNWIARLGGLPAYVQNIAKGVMKSGKTESQAIQIAIGTIKRWARGGGKVSPEVRAAAAKALAEWEALRAKNAAKKVVKAASGANG